MMLKIQITHKIILNVSQLRVYEQVTITNGDQSYKFYQQYKIKDMQWSLDRPKVENETKEEKAVHTNLPHTPLN